MSFEPKSIKPGQIVEIIFQAFKGKAEITAYVGSNAATPRASLKTLMRGTKSDNFDLLLMKIVHLLLHGLIPYVEEGWQNQIMM